ncbi:hypothetical protein AMECASPLE_029213 [Ameca splendens]|uniref:Uncharacterized protein n=1 Tax=Ameca splendens TaxID=208324 RepID=A0ABV0ZFH5_9TELE
MSEYISENNEGGEVCNSASIEKYNAIFKPTSDELDGIVLTQSNYDVYLQEVSGCNRLPPKKSKLRRKLVLKKDNPIPTEHIHGREGKNISNDLIQNHSLDNIQHNCTSLVQEELKPPGTVKIQSVRKYITSRNRRRLSALYTRAKLVRSLMNEAALMVEQIPSRPGQQQRRQRVSLSLRDHRNKASTLTLLAACQTLLLKHCGDIKVI